MAEETVLLIDIDGAEEQKITSDLESEGYLVFTAAGRNMAAQIAEKVKPSLVCINPAPSGGLEICRELHDKPFLKHVPIIIVTSYSGSMDPRYTALYGIVDFLKTPFSREQLLEKVEKFLMAGMPEPLPENPKKDLSGTALEEKEGGKMPEAFVPDDAELDYEDNEGTGVPEFSGATEKQAFAGTIRSREQARKSGRRTFVLVLALVLITAAAIGAGIYGYRFFGQRDADTRPLKVSPAAVQPDMSKTPPAQENTQTDQPPQPPVQKPVPEQVPQTPAPDKTGGAASVKKPPKHVMHSVQAGAFKNEQNAEALAKQIREHGLEAVVRKGQTKDKEDMYRVLIGEYAERKDAVAAAGRVRNKIKTNVTIFSE